MRKSAFKSFARDHPCTDVGFLEKCPKKKKKYNVDGICLTLVGLAGNWISSLWNCFTHMGLKVLCCTCFSGSFFILLVRVTVRTYPLCLLSNLCIDHLMLKENCIKPAKLKPFAICFITKFSINLWCCSQNFASLWQFLLLFQLYLQW